MKKSSSLLPLLACMLLFVTACSAQDKISEQDQIYIVAGTLGGIVLILILLVLALSLAVSNLKGQVVNKPLVLVEQGSAKQEPISAYDNNSFANDNRPQPIPQPQMQERRPEPKGDPLKDQYSVYTGRQPDRYGNSRQSMVRSEDSISPYGGDKPALRSGGGNPYNRY